MIEGEVCRKLWLWWRWLWYSWYLRNQIQIGEIECIEVISKYSEFIFTTVDQFKHSTTTIQHCYQFLFFLAAHFWLEMNWCFHSFNIILSFPCIATQGWRPMLVTICLLPVCMCHSLNLPILPALPQFGVLSVPSVDKFDPYKRIELFSGEIPSEDQKASLYSLYQSLQETSSKQRCVLHPACVSVVRGVWEVSEWNDHKGSAEWFPSAVGRSWITSTSVYITNSIIKEMMTKVLD